MKMEPEKGLPLAGDREPKKHVGLHGGPFANRQDVGQRLASALVRYQDQHPVVLALQRDGVPVAFEIAKAMNAPLDILLVRELRAPESTGRELGAVVDEPRPERILDESVIESQQVTADYIDSEVRVQLQIIEEGKRRYRGDHLFPTLSERTVILADDGTATLPMILAGLKALALAEASRTVVAVPLAPHAVAQSLAGQVDDLVCLLVPDEVRAVDFYYADFTPPTDDEVIELLRKGSSPVDGTLPADALRWP